MITGSAPQVPIHPWPIPKRFICRPIFFPRLKLKGPFPGKRGGGTRLIYSFTHSEIKPLSLFNLSVATSHILINLPNGILLWHP